MTLSEIRDRLQAWDECHPLNKTAFHGQLSAAALTRQGETVKLWLVQHDPTYVERLEEAELAALDHPQPYPATNRERLLQPQAIEADLPLEHLKAVCLGGQEYPVCGGRATPVRGKDWETVLALANLLRAGWEPEELSDVNPEGLVLSEHELRGSFPHLPFQDELTLIPNDKVETKVFPAACTLPFDADIEPLPFTLPDSNTAWLLRAEWFDPWKHLEETLAHPKIMEQLTPEEIAQRRLQIEASYEDFCPRGMALPVVLYEAEPPVSLYFYESAWLEAPVKASSSAFAVMGLYKGEQKDGPHGLPIHGAALSEPALDPETVKELSIGMARWNCRYPQPSVSWPDPISTH